MLYRELNLDIIHRHTYEDLKTILQVIVSTYGKSIRSIRIHIGNGQNGFYIDQWSFIMGVMAVILSKCTNATEVAVYYKDGKEGDFGELGNQIIRMVEAKQVVAFGLFSTTIMRRSYGSSVDRSLRDTDAPMRMLEQLLHSQKACQALRRLDLVMEDISTILFDLVRSRCTSLQSLTVRRGLRRRLPGIFSSQHVWAPNDNLASLKFMACNSAYAPHIPLIVQHFKNLKELVWATCGHHHDVITPLPLAGWKKDPAFQPLIRRKPLDHLVLEHALEWEIGVLGVIPAETVTVANIDELRLVRSMRRRVEMFPGLKLLKVLPQNPENQEVDEYGVTSASVPPIGEPLPTLDSLCAEMGIILKRDAKLMHPCSCCSNIEM